MDYSLPQFTSHFPSDESCLDAIKKMRYPNGIRCTRCKKVTRHYKVAGRPAYVCRSCRKHTYPLAGTLFAKTATPLTLWFYALFLMTHTRSRMSAKQLERELGVTYKTAWRMHTRITSLMAQNNGDLLAETEEKVHRWVFFNKIEFTVAQKQQSLE